MDEQEYRDFYHLMRFVAEEGIYDNVFLFPEGEERVVCHLNVSDQFAYASADSEPITAADIPQLREDIRRCQRLDATYGDLLGCLLFVTRRRKQLPLSHALPHQPELLKLFYEAVQ